MAAISATLVKQLRDQTGAGMMDCKTALQESDGNLDAATDWLRKKGLAAAAKKAGRATSEGLVAVIVEGNSGAMIELNSETDFVARNDEFQSLVRQILPLALTAGGDIDALKAASVPGTGRSVADEVTEAVARIGENLNLRRCAAVKVDQGHVGHYVHASLGNDMGRIGVLVGLRSAGNASALHELGKQLAMHVAASNPQAVDADSLDPALVARERAIHAEQAATSGKPPAIVEKIVDGRMRKYYEDVVLLEQAFVVDPDTKVKDAVAKAAAAAGAPIEVTGFVRMALGEGVEATSAAA